MSGLILDYFFKGVYKGVVKVKEGPRVGEAVRDMNTRSVIYRCPDHTNRPQGHDYVCSRVQFQAKQTNLVHIIGAIICK